MSKLKSFFGYVLAFLGVPIILATLMGSSAWIQMIANSGLVVSPLYSGGEVVRTVQHGSYRTEIHQTVFAALIGESQEGFVQVAWRPKGFVPVKIDEEIDYNGDGVSDFRIQWDRAANQTTLTPASPNVLRLEGAYELKERYAIRVHLKNDR